MIYISKTRYDRVVIKESNRAQLEAMGIEVGPISFGNIVILIEGTKLPVGIYSEKDFELQFESVDQLVEKQNSLHKA